MMIQAFAKWHHRFVSIAPWNFTLLFLKCIKLTRTYQMYSIVTICTLDSYYILVWMQGHYNLLDYFPASEEWVIIRFQASSQVLWLPKWATVTAYDSWCHYDAIFVVIFGSIKYGSQSQEWSKYTSSPHISIEFATQWN